MDELGIDQKIIVIMIENYRTQKPWRLFMKKSRSHQRPGTRGIYFVALHEYHRASRANPGRSYPFVAIANGEDLRS